MLAAANSPGARILVTAADNRGARILDHSPSSILHSRFHGPARLKISSSSRSTLSSERRHGVRAALLRGLLYALSFIYERLVQLRLFLYRHRIFREHTLGCLVISIGNLTVGGTGKTPIVEKFARALRAGGRRVAILSRGYKSVPRPAPRKWAFLAKKNRRRRGLFPTANRSSSIPSLLATSPTCSRTISRTSIVLVDKDRVKSGLFAIKELKADTLLLDDGLQYLHLKAPARYCPDRSPGAVRERTSAPARHPPRTARAISGARVTSSLRRAPASQTTT